MQISVVIPTYNRAALLREALDSVLSQTHKDLQVIVVDDGSSDYTDKVLDEFASRVQSVRLGRSGIGIARNRGIDMATGEFIAFLDNDDLWSPVKIEKHLEFACAHPENIITYTDASEFSAHGVARKSFVENFPALNDPSDLFTSMITKYAIPLTSTTMIKTSFLKETGLRFPVNVSYAEDLVLFLDISLAGGKFGYLPEKLTMRRIHESNFSGNHCRRFENRKALYTDLLAKDRAMYTPQQISVIKAGLRDARYRVGECRWEQLKLSEARNEFFHTLAPDARGMRAATYGLLTLLPTKFITSMRSFKAQRQIP